MQRTDPILHPITDPFAVHRLDVGDGHQLYVEECGRRDGVPALFLHGGPGAGCEPAHRGFFDPERYHLVLFDQRGCGRSRPHAALGANTTWDLVEDIERIREHLGIERWLVFGGSWGSTLALAYAETHPERVSALVVRGIFLCRDAEIQWFYQQGASWIFPDHWADFIAPIPEAERDDLLHAYHRRLTGDDEVARMAAAKAWSIWEGRCSTLRPNDVVSDHFADPHLALSLARIECHYFVNHAFLAPEQLLRDAGRLAGIPGVIVQGRYDLICPMRSAWELHQAWPEARFEVIPDAGHSAFEPGIQHALVTATDRFASELGGAA
ncbi:prolyl aminopeptidase [Marichromatium bheemlicum]|uniref:Proline iminopeptidase n=1 Tax=Marichromatium bheemlicum TaxID=365339 RepID=A0ABX1I8Z2_9GAMM|nr:prolyl aminopeptidase [Marichromatium bheemlicum]NKN32616.1 prolyl aminopeptidase [Marichromatium bheemlicum]